MFFPTLVFFVALVVFLALPALVGLLVGEFVGTVLMVGLAESVIKSDPSPS